MTNFKFSAQIHRNDLKTITMDYNININKICRVCLEENAVTSIFHTEFAMIPAEMLMLCAKVRVSLQRILTRILFPFN